MSLCTGIGKWRGFGLVGVDGIILETVVLLKCAAVNNLGISLFLEFSSKFYDENTDNTQHEC